MNERAMTARRFGVLLIVGLAIRAAALPLPGTGDVLIWKTWSYNAVAHGEVAVYGVGGHPPARADLAYPGSRSRFMVDYPPIAVYAVGAAGRLYRRFDPAMRDTAWFTACLKLPPIAAEAGLAWIVYLVARKRAGASRARWAALACWLNPAMMLSGAFLGYLDPMVLPLGVAAVVAGATGSTWMTGALCATAVLVKPQGALAAPVAACAVAAFTWTNPERVVERLLLRLGETAAGAALVVVAVLAPFAVAGTLPNLVAGVGSIAGQDMLSGNAANLWWILTWVVRSLDVRPALGTWQAFTALPRVLNVSVTTELGYPDARFVGLGLLTAAGLWTAWQIRRARDPWLFAGAAAFLVQAYFALGANVHENHLLIAVPLAVVAAVGRPGWTPIAIGLTALQALNLDLFYGLDGVGTLAIPRNSTVIDAAVVLAAANLALLAWHAWRLGHESTRPPNRGRDLGTSGPAA